MHYQPLHPFFETILANRSKKVKGSDLEDYLKETIFSSSSALSSPESFAAMIATNQDPKMEWTKSVIAIDELLWNERGRQVIFIENKEFVDAILSSKFDVDVVKNLEPLSDSFQLVLPKDCKNEFGDIIPNVLVNWFAKGKESVNTNLRITRECYEHFGEEEMYQEHRDLTADFIKQSGIDARHEMNQAIDVQNDNYDAEDFQIMNLTMTDRDGDGVVVKSMYEHKFASALNGEFTSDEERVVNTVLKLVLGLAIYINAGGHLRQGFPSQRAIVTKARKSLDKGAKGDYSVKFISFAKEMKTKSGFVRGFHFRNLKAERYYQGDYANLPLGSRWVFVNPSWVGGSINAKTAHL